MDFITFKHSFNAGDLITVLPGIKHICEKNNTKAIVYQRLNLPADYGHNDAHPVMYAGKQVCMNRQIFDMMRPLIEAQDYIERFDTWEGEPVQFDYDKTRQNAQMPLPGGSIHKWPSLIYPQLECDLSAKWITLPDDLKLHMAWEIEMAQLVPGLTVEQLVNVYHQTGKLYLKKEEPSVVRSNYCNNKIIINRTARYQNPYIDYTFLRKYSWLVVFTGTEQEYSEFCARWDLHVAYLSIESFVELADAIKRCKLFIGNQSLCWHIADAMKVPRILEICTQYPNTFPTGDNGYSFITQEALEFRFHKLLNENNA